MNDPNKPPQPQPDGWTGHNWQLSGTAHAEGFPPVTGDLFGDNVSSATGSDDEAGLTREPSVQEHGVDKVPSPEGSNNTASAARLDRTADFLTRVAGIGELTEPTIPGASQPQEDAPVNTGQGYLDKLLASSDEEVAAEQPIGNQKTTGAAPVQPATEDTQPDAEQGRRTREGATDDDEEAWYENAKPWQQVTPEKSRDVGDNPPAADTVADKTQPAARPSTGPLPPGSMRGTRQTVHQDPAGNGPRPGFYIPPSGGY